MKFRTLLPILVLGLFMVGVAVGWADVTDEPTDFIGENGSVKLSQQFYCMARSVLAGQFGLLLGFALAIYGLYLLVKKPSTSAVVVIICGALLTALPGLIETTGKGFWTLTAPLRNSGGSFTLPSC